MKVCEEFGLAEVMEQYLIRITGGEGPSKEELLARLDSDEERFRCAELLETLEAVWNLLHPQPADLID